MKGNETSEELIADYMRKELAAMQIVTGDHGQIVYTGERNEYLVEIKVHTLGPTPTRLIEGGTK